MFTWSTIHCTIKYFSCRIASSCPGTQPVELKWYVKYSLSDTASVVTVHKLPCNGLKWLSTNFLHNSTAIFLNLARVFAKLWITRLVSTNPSPMSILISTGCLNTRIKKSKCQIHIQLLCCSCDRAENCIYIGTIFLSGIRMH